MRRLYAAVLLIGAILALSTVRFSKGEPLPIPPNMLVVYGHR